MSESLQHDGPEKFAKDNSFSYLTPKPFLKSVIELKKDGFLSEKDLKDTIFWLHRFGKDREKFVKDTMQELIKISASLQYLEEKYPNDEDLKNLHILYDDLLDDFNRGNIMRLDIGFDECINKANKEITDAGVRVEAPEDSVVSETVKKLQAIGIEPEYVVTTGNPEAKTVVLFTQIHTPSPLAYLVSRDLFEKLSADAIQSQDEIYNFIKSAHKEGLLDVIFDEGTYFGEEVVNEDFWPDNLSAGFKLSKVPGFTFRGYEDRNLHLALFESNPSDATIRHRTTANNIFLADNVAEQVKQSGDDSSAVILGHAHEAMLLGEPGAHELPFSKILAYKGVNVIVVDSASKYYDPTLFEKYKDKIKAALEKRGFVFD